MSLDVLAQIAELPRIAPAVHRSRDAVDQLLWDRQARSVASELARQSQLRGAWASAAMEGAEIPLDSVLVGRIEDSPMGEKVRRSVVVTEGVPPLVDVFEKAPLQAWARLSALASAGLVPEDQVGRPRQGMEADDPLRLGALPSPQECADRLTALGTVCVSPSTAPAIVTAAVVHAELAVLRPFVHGSGLVARASIRLVLASRGVDPDLLTIPEAGLLGAGRPKYVRALNSYAEGSSDGMVAWVTWFCDAVRLGAVQAHQLVPDLG